MMSRLLPSAVVAAEAFEDAPDTLLFPEEEAAVAGVGDGRRREFTTVRHCARRALRGLGLQPVPLVPGRWGAPGWPDGVVGSMTHTRGYRAAAVARSTDVRALGVDAEPHRALGEGVLRTISLPEERERQAGLERADASVCWDRLLFCAKEAVYKAWFPLTGIPLSGFRDVMVTFHPAGGTFDARVLGAGAGHTEAVLEEGRWIAAGDLLLTAVSLPPGPDV
ncbi:4'-phosphopantetheinyl transferase superfamily protein [Streptomyces sp. SID8378]|nr:4'-phosphopantetheinyl transferase superfamily protein [Streptomyces sp. SID8378]PVD00179.1 4'-phosphopantetheinyl transferase [Streptomyces sp. CS147]